MTYQIKLPQFEGPFDLLLFFIEKDELNIHDIPIAKLTNDFLAYLKKMQELNIDLASDFMLMAATLMRIKARMLLPRPELDEEGEEIDPREELVRKLLEYKQFKSMLETLENMEDERSKKYDRKRAKIEQNYIAEKYSAEVELESLNLYKILQTFNQVLERFEDRKNRTKFSVVKYPYTIKQQRDYFRHLLTKTANVAFKQLFDSCENAVHAIYRFLAVLEMTQEKVLTLTIGEDFNNFWISKGEKYGD